MWGLGDWRRGDLDIIRGSGGRLFNFLFFVNHLFMVAFSFFGFTVGKSSKIFESFRPNNGEAKNFPIEAERSGKFLNPIYFLRGSVFCPRVVFGEGKSFCYIYSAILVFDFVSKFSF